ncbi:protein no-on-transient A-like isoform X2 [Leptopilina boulardi]|uniref:protein no-on-transient A-like isoform X2 n=1 Tax=Leptopilina boulardi TaxID=63433 RepID=UPI0021F5C2C4|nr:protein no-on-transient A-like isoform X2 [Leptopilina boulardi]
MSKVHEQDKLFDYEKEFPKLRKPAFTLNRNNFKRPLNGKSNTENDIQKNAYIKSLEEKVKRLENEKEQNDNAKKNQSPQNAESTGNAMETDETSDQMQIRNGRHKQRAGRWVQARRRLANERKSKDFIKFLLEMSEQANRDNRYQKYRGRNGGRGGRNGGRGGLNGGRGGRNEGRAGWNGGRGGRNEERAGKEGNREENR